MTITNISSIIKIGANIGSKIASNPGSKIAPKIGGNILKQYNGNTERKIELLNKGYSESVVDQMIDFELGLAITATSLTVMSTDIIVGANIFIGGPILVPAINIAIGCSTYNLYEKLARYISEQTFKDYQNPLDTDIDLSQIPMYMQNDPNKKFIDITKKALTTSQKPSDPIIFDLNGDNKLETTNTTNGVFFDHDNDGFAEASAWVGENDGILVVDSNNNGQIDNGTEVLLHSTLTAFDTNNDGIIDANDDNFNNLKILKGDGTLMTLAEAGITSINLNTTSTEITDENGNQQFASGTFARADGTTGTFGEFLVSTDTSDSTATEWLEETDEIAELPDISGNGNIYSLHQAMRHVA